MFIGLLEQTWQFDIIYKWLQGFLVLVIDLKEREREESEVRGCATGLFSLLNSALETFWRDFPGFCLWNNNDLSVVTISQLVHHSFSLNGWHCLGALSNVRFEDPFSSFQGVSLWGTRSCPRLPPGISKRNHPQLSKCCCWCRFSAGQKEVEPWFSVAMSAPHDKSQLRRNALSYRTNVWEGDLVI